DLMLALPAERAVEDLAAVAGTALSVFGHAFANRCNGVKVENSTRAPGRKRGGAGFRGYSPRPVTLVRSRPIRRAGWTRRDGVRAPGRPGRIHARPRHS